MAITSGKISNGVSLSVGQQSSTPDPALRGCAFPILRLVFDSIPFPRKDGARQALRNAAGVKRQDQTQLQVQNSSNQR
jgi:hypothetical protein